MEISSNRLSPLYPSHRQGKGAVGDDAFREGHTVEVEEDNRGERPSPAGATSPTTGETPDYRELVRRTRLAGGVETATEGAEAYRIGAEPMRVQRALGVYRATAELQEGGAQLMPRIDGYV